MIDKRISFEKVSSQLQNPIVLDHLSWIYTR